MKPRRQPEPLFEIELEERVAAALACDPTMLELADEMELAHFASAIARALFTAIRNVQAAGDDVTPASVEARIARDDERRGKDSLGRELINANTIPLMLEARGGAFATMHESIIALRRLAMLRHRRETLLGLEAR